MKYFVQQVLIWSCCGLLLWAGVAQAQGRNPAFSLLNPDTAENIDYLSDHTAVSYNSQTDKTTLARVIADMIYVFLGLLGILFVIIVVIAGYHWMTAGGREEKVEKARNLISRGLIGLLIIVAAYAITYWVFARLPY